MLWQALNWPKYREVCHAHVKQEDNSHVTSPISLGLNLRQCSYVACISSPQRPQLGHICVPTRGVIHIYLEIKSILMKTPLLSFFFNVFPGFLICERCGGVRVCFTDSNKLLAQSASCHSSHVLESSLDSWQHASSRFVSNGMRKFTQNKAVANRHWSQESIPKGQITASMWQTALEFVLSCECEIQSICFHTTTTAITLFSAIHNTQIGFCQGLKLSSKSITCYASHWNEHKRCALMHI